MTTTPRLAGKVAVVMGSSTGLGRSIALKIAEEGALLVVCASRTEKYDGTEEATHQTICNRYGPGKAVFKRTDLANPIEVEACIMEAVSKGGKLDV